MSKTTLRKIRCLPCHDILRFVNDF